MAVAASASVLPHLWKSTLLSGVVAVILGTLMLVWPRITIVSAAVFLGAYLLISGGAQVVFAFSMDGLAGGRLLLLISGAVSLILAVLAFRHFNDAVTLLAIWSGIGFLLRGVATTAAVISDPGLAGRCRNIFFGVISIVAGIVVLASPFESLVTLTLVVGIWLIVMGVFEVVTALSFRSADSRHVLHDMFGDVRMLCHDVGLMNPFAVLMWRICKIDGRPSRYRNEPQRAHPPTRDTSG
jgi:uncharacterized membrane protein HdeD (DUF308 family)